MCGSCSISNLHHASRGVLPDVSPQLALKDGLRGGGGRGCTGIYGRSVGFSSARRCKLVCGMGKEQELLEASRTGNVALVEKLLSGKKGILGSGSGSIPLPNLLR